VKRVQERIFRASREKKWAKLKNLQKLLARSRSARLLAVRRVTQINAGKHTAGIDGEIYLVGGRRLKLFQEISLLDPRNYRCQPVRRTTIPKPDGGERPLGIPTIKDRVMQAIVKMALEPEWEARFEPNSYGFRPGRRCQDAIRQIRSNINIVNGKATSEWILDADISRCFDMIDHDMLLDKIPVFRKTVRRWLKAGVVELGNLIIPTRGTPQGGVISPLLANIALDGMERLFDLESRTGRYKPPSERSGCNRGVSLVRYADDFVVTAPSRDVLATHVNPAMETFLGDRGMNLNMAKTRVVHREEGFDFLGFSIRQFNRKGNKICLVTPSKNSMKRLLGKVKDVLNSNKQAKASTIVGLLNPVLRGWANYYKHCNAKKAFAYMDYRVWQMVWHWCLRRHPMKGKRWVKKRYFIHAMNRDWVFGENDGRTLFILAKVRVDSSSYVKVRGYNSPFDPELREYWSKRESKARIQRVGPHLL
jgi:RNA-directed DNA polymerase